MEYKKLRNGILIPTVGFGTWQAENGEEAYNSVINALSAGYTHIDTAAVYGNEESVGKAIKDSKIKREKLFITTKLWNNDRGYNETINAFQKSLTKLGLNYIDLYLIHWPNPVKYRSNYKMMNAASWRAIEDLYKDGRIKAIGVSNFLVHHLEELKDTATIMPMVNQIKLHPGLIQNEVIEYCQKEDILIEAYSPLGTGRLLENETVVSLAKKYGKSASNICVRYSLEKGYVPLVKSVHKERIVDNLNVFDFKLTKSDVDALDKVESESKLKDIDKINY